MPRTSNKAPKDSTAHLGFEAKLWLAADKLRNNMDAAEYKHVVLGLIFLKYISDRFEEHRAKLAAGQGDYAGANPEDPDEYRAENIFWVPPEARWGFLQANAKQPGIGKAVDDAMVAIERDNPRLKGVLPKDYARPTLDKHRLGELIDLIATINLVASIQPSSANAHRSVDLLGRVYEYFLTMFASAEGKNGGQFYTPSCVVRLLVEMLAPYKGRIYDPACGSGGMFVQSEKFVESHGGRLGDISVYGQESNPTTRRLAIMNLAIRGIEADFGPEHADTFRRDLHPDLRAEGQRQLCVGAALHPPPRPGRLCRVRAGQREHVLQPIRRRRHPEGHHRGRPRGLHGRPAGATVLQLHAKLNRSALCKYLRFQLSNGCPNGKLSSSTRSSAERSRSRGSSCSR
jgi:type I restriction enzyme M protein